MEKIKDSRFELVDSSKLNSEVVVRPNISFGKMHGEGLRKIQWLWELYLY